MSNKTKKNTKAAVSTSFTVDIQSGRDSYGYRRHYTFNVFKNTNGTVKIQQTVVKTPAQARKAATEAVVTRMAPVDYADIGKKTAAALQSATTPEARSKALIKVANKIKFPALTPAMTKAIESLTTAATRALAE